MKIRVGFGLGTTAAGAMDAEAFWTVVDTCERLRWDSLWFSERVTGNLADPVVAMAALAGRTRRLKFGPSVMVLPGRNPVLLAKALASIDVLSAGRLVVAFGLGADAPGEAQAFGVERRERAGRAREATELIKLLWTSDAVSYRGRYFGVEDLTIRPRPVQSPHPDVWFGGHSEPALRRVATIGDGWLPSFVAAGEYRSRAQTIRETAASCGREIDDEHYGALVGYLPDGPDADRMLGIVRARRPDADPRDVVVVGGPDALRVRLEQFIEQGASKFVVLPFVPPSDWAQELSVLRELVAVPLEN